MSTDKNGESQWYEWRAACPDATPYEIWLAAFEAGRTMPSSTAIVPPSWVAFSKAAGETSEGVMRRALGDIASISPLSTAAPQEIARNALIAAEALATPVSAIERSQVLHLLAVFRRARRHIEYRGAFTPHTEMLRQMDLQLEIFKGFDGLGPDVHDDIGHTR